MMMKRCISHSWRLLGNRGNSILQKRSFSAKKDELILGIESSCDDTGVSVIGRHSKKVFSKVVSSNPSIHEKWRGIVPNLAAREHEAKIDFVVNEAMSQAGLNDFKQLSAVAVTVGPGLGPCLAVGIGKAKQIAMDHSLPLVAVNHLEAHALVARLQPEIGSKIQFPFLVLLLSGGHSQLLVCYGVGKYTQLGGTIDDALGEAYDKVVRELGLNFALAGAALENEAKLFEKSESTGISFNLPLARIDNCDLSFAGLKSAVFRTIEQQREMNGKELNPKIRAEIAYAFQETALTHVNDRTKRALKWLRVNHPELRMNCLVVAGGVAKNQRLRFHLSESMKQWAETSFEIDTLEAERNDETNRLEGKTKLDYLIPVYYPEMEFCTDNGTMIAWTGAEILNAVENKNENNEDSTVTTIATPNSSIQSLRERIFYPNQPNFKELLEKLQYKPKWPIASDFVTTAPSNKKQTSKQQRQPYVEIKRKGLKEKFSHVTNKL